jgi:hypothetical protein
VARQQRRHQGINSKRCDDPFEKIAQLKRLSDAGAITQEDFQKKEAMHSVLSQI